MGSLIFWEIIYFNKLVHTHSCELMKSVGNMSCCCYWLWRWSSDILWVTTFIRLMTTLIVSKMLLWRFLCNFMNIYLRVGLGSTDTKETAAGQTIVHAQPVACWIITVWNLFNGARFYVYNIMERKICRTSPCEHGFYSIWIGFMIERDMTWEMTWAKDISDLTHRQIPKNTIYLDSSTFLESFFAKCFWFNPS